jgi:hypothetical protein
MNRERLLPDKQMISSGIVSTQTLPSRSDQREKRRLLDKARRIRREARVLPRGQGRATLEAAADQIEAFARCGTPQGS